MAIVPEREYSVPKEQASALLRLALSIPFAKTITGAGGRRGIRFAVGKIAIESYTCFEEPVLEPWRGWRLVLWKTRKENRSRTWQRVPSIFTLPGKTRGIGRVHAGYRKDWKGNSRRSAEWHEKKKTVIKKVSLSEFGKEYHASSHLDPFLRYGMIKVAKDHLSVHPENVHIILGFYKEQIAGGAIFVDFPDIKTSSYIASFLNKNGRTYAFGCAFIDWWYKNMLISNLTWADFGIMWQPGDPKGWRGSSEFKKHFHPNLYTIQSHWKIK